MKIAALIQAHKKPELLQALARRLDTDLWNIYVHIDAKCDAAPFKAVAKNAVFLDQRVKVYWGGFSQVAASLALLRTALADARNTHFYSMSGQCYPIKTDAEITAKILTAKAGNYISMWEMPVSHKPLIRLTRRYAYDIGNDLLKRSLNRLLSYLPERKIEELLHGLAPWGGSSWWLLNRDVAADIIDFVDRNPWYSRAFRSGFCPDEAFFQTLVAHFGAAIDDATPTKTSFIEGSYHPAVVDAELLLRLHGNWHFFARKFEQPGNSL